MSSRTRSPSYPSTPIEQAIEFVRKLHQVERTNPIDRAVAAKALGYTGLSGRSATVLSDLSQYGLVERAGKSEIRVTSLAVELLHPDDRASWEASLLDAAKNPELFQKVTERFTDGLPSSNALESFLIKQGFTYAAIPSAIRAFQETFSYLENAIESESSSQGGRSVRESQPVQRVEEIAPVHHSKQPMPARNVPRAGEADIGAEVSFSQKRIWLSGVVANQVEADELIATITALRPMLPSGPMTLPVPTPAAHDEDE